MSRQERAREKVVAEARRFLTDTASMDARGRMAAFDRLADAVSALDAPGETGLPSDAEADAMAIELLQARVRALSKALGAAVEVMGIWLAEGSVHRTYNDGHNRRYINIGNSDADVEGARRLLATLRRALEGA